VTVTDPTKLTVTIEDQIKCAERELKYREWLYPVWVKDSKMKPDKALKELQAMGAIIETLKRVQPELTVQPSLFDSTDVINHPKTPDK